MSAANGLLSRTYSRPLKRQEVPPVEELTSEVLLELYLSGGQLSNLDQFWYFRPWRGGKPKESGVYFRRQCNDHAGFAYFDASYGVWLMTWSRKADAIDQGELYRKEPNALKRELSFESNHQNVFWSDASLDGIEVFYTVDGIDPDTAITLATLRYAIDPQRKRRQAG